MCIEGRGRGEGNSLVLTFITRRVCLWQHFNFNSFKMNGCVNDKK